MKRSDSSYIITSLFFVIAFAGFSINPNIAGGYLWYAALAAGTIAFIVRIITGDD